jgi:hypothetical protein
MKFIRRRGRILAIAAVAVVALAGVAAAYWTQGGSGVGSAGTGNTVGITVNQTSVIGGLFPGGPAQSLSGNFNNPNAGNVYVGTVTAIVQPGWTSQTDLTKPKCTAADFVIGGSAPVNAEIAPGNGVGAWSGLTIAMTDSATNQDNCKGLSVPVNYTAQ